MEGLNPISLYKRSLKSGSFRSDEIINLFLLRPIASVIVWILYPTPVTPNQVTAAAIVAGCAAAIAYGAGSHSGILAGGLLIMLKDILDDADGQLARAKQMYSRRGRFLDSIGDAVVNIFVFSAITAAVYQRHESFFTIILGAASLAGITLRVSYHVFYQVSYLHLQKSYMLNRVTEEITEADIKGDPVAYWLQRVFNVIYGWQDRLMLKIDGWCRGVKPEKNDDVRWFDDRTGLFFSGLLGFGTEYTLLFILSCLDNLYLYLFLNVFGMTGILLISVLYRKLSLAKRISKFRTM